MHVHVAENETVRVGDVMFAGATLWTDIGLNGHAHRAMMTAGDQMNDFKKIRIGPTAFRTQGQAHSKSDSQSLVSRLESTHNALVLRLTFFGAS